MRWSILLVLLAAQSALAQPVSFELKPEVPIGQKPVLRLRATQQVTDVRVQLERDDGKKFTLRHAGLAKGQTIDLAIGDGAGGKATYTGTLSAQVVGSGAWSDDVTFETLVRAPMKVSYDADHLDLDKHVLQFKLSRPAGKAELVVIGEDGKEIGTGAATYNKEAADTWVSITWTQPASTRVMMMKLHVTSADGIASNLELIPWSVTVDHEDVNFKTDSSVIEASESGKLDASLAKINEIAKRVERFMKMKLYVAGHTDTVGGDAKNKKLSNDRAMAIAKYFKRKGIAMPIAVAGFGERVLKVNTPQETDERANRRADYVIGPAGGAPPFKGPYLKVRADWKQLR